MFSTNARCAQSGPQRFGDRRGRGLANRAIGRVQAGETGLERGRLAVELDHDRRHLLVEQPFPGTAAGHRLLGEHDLLGLGEQVRPVPPPGRAKVMRGEGEPIVGEELLDLLVGELRPRSRRTRAWC